jgi:hypothetical protein
MIIVSDTFLELSSSAQSRKELTPSTGLEWSGVERPLNKGKKNSYIYNLASLLYLSLVAKLGNINRGWKLEYSRQQPN